MTAEQVQAFEPFATLTGQEAEVLARHATQHRVGRGDFLFRQGEPAGCVALLAEGQVKLEHGAVDGTVVIVDVLGAGNALFFLETDVCPVGVVALGPVEYAKLAGQDLEAVVRTHPGIAVALLHYVAGRLHRAYVGQRAAVRSEVRLANALTRIAADSTTHVVSLSHADLAEVAGMARETVTRHLRRWRELGIVELGMRTIRVRDVATLRRLAEDD